MKKNNECIIVQELIPNYIEKLLKDEAVKYVENHLKECDECQNVLNNMIENMEQSNIRNSKEEIDYFKKYRNKLNILKAIILSSIIIFALVILTRTMIMTDLTNKSNLLKEGHSDNYYLKLQSYSNGTVSIGESYYKNGNYLTKTTTYDEKNGEQKMIFYKNEDEYLTLTDDGNIKRQSDAFMPLEVGTIAYTSTFFENLITAFTITIDKVELDEKECYVLKDKYQEKYIDKNTGIIVKLIDKSNNRTVDYHYEYGTVNEIVKPNISEFENI